MILFDDVTVTYPAAHQPALRGATARVEEGELCLVVGPTGAGKSTLLRAAAGLVPHFSGGLLEGAVVIDGRDTRTHLPRDLADVVGVVVQDPAAGFVCDTVEEELAYAMEQLAVPPATMRKRVEEVLDLLGLARLRGRPLADLSGGEQQRVAIGAVMTNHPRVLILDEPTSALDPSAAEDVLAALTRLVHDLGMTVLMAEHRLERVVQHADSVLVVSQDGAVHQGPPAEVLASSPIAPPIVELARLAGWSPVPLSVRDARRRAPELRRSLADADDSRTASDDPDRCVRTDIPPALVARGLQVRHGRVRAVRDVDLTVRPGEVLALMGRNGAGKSSLLWALQGSGPRASGTVRISGRTTSGDQGTDPASLRPADARRLVTLVPQSPADLLYLDTVAAECSASDRTAGAPAGGTATLLERLAPGVDPAAHPRDLSEGQRLGLVLAIQLAADPTLVLLDEPTRGLDYVAKRILATVLAEHAAAGGAVLLSSHDVEFVAECAQRVVVLADGEVVADGPATQVLVASPVFAPQVAKILHPVEMLTIGEVRRALAARA